MRGLRVGLVLAVGALLAAPVLAGDNVEAPWGTPNGNLYGWQRPGLNVDPLLNGLEEAWQFDTVANGLNRTFYQTGQIVFDAAGNIYWVAGAANLASVDPQGNLRWKTPIPTGSSTPGYSPVVGSERVYTLSGVNPGATVGAYRKDTGAKIWETAITADGFQNQAGLTPVLYDGKLYIVTIGAGYGLAVTQVDAATGKQDWHSLLDAAVSGASDGTVTFVPGVYTDTGEHGLFFNTNNSGNESTEKDVWAIRINPASGATTAWNTFGGKRARSHLVYSDETGHLYAATWSDFGYSFAAYDPMAGLLGTFNTGDGHGYYDVSPLSFDDESVIAAGFEGRVWVYHDDGAGKIDQLRKFKTYPWYGELRCFGQVFEAANGHEILLSGTNSRTDLDASYTSRIVLLDITAGAVVPGVEDGPINIDDLEVYSGIDYNDAIGKGPVYTEDFSSYNVGDKIKDLPSWTDNSSGTPLPEPVLMADPDQGNAMQLDAYGNNFENQAAVSVALPQAVPNFDAGEQFVIIRWKQWRQDLTDNVYNGTDSQEGAFQWDQDGKIRTAKGWTMEWPLTAKVWQQIELQYSYNDNTVYLFVDGNMADGFPDELDDLFTEMSTLVFVMDPTPPVTDDKVPFSEPLVEYDTKINANHGPIERGGPLLGPDGKVYFFDTNTRKLVALKPVAPPFVKGDANGDGFVDFNDIDCFVAALIGLDNWLGCGTGYPAAGYVPANDINGDGSVDFNDIDGFVECIINGGC